MVDYDKTRWFELLTSGSLESVAQELQTSQKTFLLSATNQTAFNQTCIFIAAKDQSESRGDQLLELLLKEGADASVKDQLNQTAVFYAAVKGHLNQIDMLVRNGADPGVSDTYGQSALFYASREGSVPVLEKLVKQHNVNVNVVDNTGQNALFYACRDGRFEAVKFLVENGINVNQVDKTKQTGLSWAKRNQRSEIVQLLLDNGAVDNTKKKRPDAPKRNTKQDKKIKCNMMIVDSKGDKRPATAEEMAEFEAKHPSIAAYWKDPEALAKLEATPIEELENIRSWEKPAKKLMNNLWRAAHAWIFHEPVDPKKLHIEDYFDIIKNPMDFGTIKKKLSNNAYGNGKDFIADVELVFSNCRTYNKPGTDAYIMGEQVHDVFQKQVGELALDQYKTDAYAGPPMQIEEAQVPSDVYLPTETEQVAEPAVEAPAENQVEQPVITQAPSVSEIGVPEPQQPVAEPPSYDRGFSFNEVTGEGASNEQAQANEPQPEIPTDQINNDEDVFIEDEVVESIEPAVEDNPAVEQPVSQPEEQPMSQPEEQPVSQPEDRDAHGLENDTAEPMQVEAAAEETYVPPQNLEQPADQSLSDPFNRFY